MTENTTKDALKDASDLRAPSFNVDLKKTKVIWGQKPVRMSAWTDTVEKVIEFHKMLKECGDVPLNAIPDEHRTLLARLVHESDEDMKLLASQVQSTLAPELEAVATDKVAGSSLLPLKTVEAAINDVAERINYGIEGGLKDFCIWRWEIRDMNHIPESRRSDMTERREDRVRGKNILQSLFNALSDSEKEAMLLKSKRKKLNPKESVTKPKKVKDVNGNSNLLSWFAAKPKAAHPTSTIKAMDTPMPDVKDESHVPTFSETFLPFRVRKGVTLAPINHFRTKKEVIVLDDNGAHFVRMEEEQRGSPSKDPLKSLINQTPSSSRPRASTYKRLHPSSPAVKTIVLLCVRDIVEQLNDATMAGDVYSAKKLISILSDRQKLPLRWLHFYENTRPMYVGTWTKTSRHVGPRTPFAKDETVDYTYDSGEEWFEEEEGEEMEDTEAVDDEDEEEEEDENNDWIVDDDELEPEEGGGLVLSLDEIGSETAHLVTKGKRRAEGGHFGFKGTKRRKVMPLKPDCKGPLWETQLGVPQESSWSRYSIRVLNDVPLFIDPLKYYPDNPQPATKGTDGFAIPALPDHILSGPSATSTPGASPLQKVGTRRKPGQAEAGGKSMLPDHLIQKMANLVIEAPIGTTQLLLIDKVHQALKAEGAKKNAVEATLKQVFIKEKGTKRWSLREEYKGVLNGGVSTGN
ncbi:hypothetical protein FRC17_009407 [Serendipita sp. 399]|nr:hypothetical protein FRC17_009407 [Serendipita sp. 399]